MNWNRILHVSGAIVGSALIAVPMLTEVVPGNRLKVASVVLGAVLAFITNLKKAAGVTALLLLVLPLHGCAFLQRPEVAKVVRCTAAVVNACRQDVMPTVTACLAAPADPTPCLLALVEAGRCATAEALACRVREATAAPVAAALMAVPDDGRKERQAERFFEDVHVVPVSP